jgi:pimeloyl-ACP methyl ester carboxylesterase
VAQVVKASDGRRLAVDVSGDPEGHAVFLMHGTPGDLFGPRPRYIFLYRLGIRLITYNRPGYPGSDRLKDRARTVADAAADVDTIAEYFDIDKFSVIGRSGGAPHSLACAADKRLSGRLVCAAALSGLAPCDADGLDWYADMAESNVTAFKTAATFQEYEDPESALPALVGTFHQQAQVLKNSPHGLLDKLRPELNGSDAEIVGDIALRRMIAQTHVKALSESVDGWVDDVIALARPWSVDFDAVSVPVLLWHGGKDTFSPVSHSRWLRNRIPTAKQVLRPDAAHFEAIKVLPEIFSWVLDQVDAAAAAAVPAAPAVGASERLRVDHAEQTAVAAGRGNVGVLGP